VCAQLLFEFGKKVCQRDDGAAGVLPQCKEVAITGDDPVSLCGDGTFENAVVRFVR